MSVNELLGSTPANRSLSRLTYNAYNRMMLPAAGLRAPGVGTAYPARDSASGLLLFSGTHDNALFGAVQLPHRWNQATNVRPYLYLRFPTEGTGVDTRWRWGLNVGSPDDVFGRAWGTYAYTAVQTIPNPKSAKKLVCFQFPASTMSGFAISAVINWSLERLAASDDADTDPSASLMVGLGVQFRSDSLGSLQENAKT